MFGEPIVSPSVLSADFTRLAVEVSAIERAGADWVHFDVIDGVFAPNITVGVPVLRKLRDATRLPIDVHLMVCDPLSKVEWFLGCNPDYVTVHWEALGQGAQDQEAGAIVRMVHDAGAKAGIALKPDTPTSALASTIQLWDMVLVMSVFPGFSGQSYIPESGERVREVAELCKAGGVEPFIQVDGGIDASTAAYVASNGADVFVSGNAVFAQDDYAAAVSSIRSAANAARFEAAEGGC